MLLYVVSNEHWYKDTKGGETYYDSGVDLYCPEDIVIQPGEMKKIDLGIQCAAYTNDGKPCGFYLYPRSSIVKTPLRLANSVGIIDSGYRGNIIAAVDHVKFGEGMEEAWGAYSVERGQRLFQLCAPNLEEIRVRVVESLDDTRRGSGGYGSTGKYDTNRTNPLTFLFFAG